MTAELRSILTCPECHGESQAVMPTDSCLWFYECPDCRKILKPLPGDCCVFCSYGTSPCPPVQVNGGCCA